MTGPEGGFYPHNSFSVDKGVEKQEASNESAVHPVFAEFSPAQLKALTAGPLNQIGWLTDLTHPAVEYLSGDTVNAMRAFVISTDAAEKSLLQKQIVAGFEEASEREMDEAA